MELRKVAMLPAAKLRFLNRSSLNIGSATWRSMNGNATNKAAPLAKEATTQGLPQPIGEVPYGVKP